MYPATEAGTSIPDSAIRGSRSMTAKALLAAALARAKAIEITQSYVKRFLEKTEK
jgi:hypothetical protein